MNRRIRRKKAKQLHRAAVSAHGDAVAIGLLAREFQPSGSVSRAIRDRALFRARRYAAQADEVLAESRALAG
jgi:hypothetical protein